MNDIDNINKRIENFPIYKRSPRLILEPPTEAVEIKKPAQKAKIGKSSLIQIIVTPIVMLAVTVGMGLLLKRGMYMMIGVASTIVTSIFSVFRFFNEKKDCNEKNIKRELVYTKYLLSMRKLIFNLRNKERECYEYNSPKILEVEKLIDEYSSRIYEKSISDADFLTLTVGYYDDKSCCPIKFDYDELKIETDELEIEAKELAEEYSTIKDKPVVIDLKNAHLGLVGSESVIHEQLHILIAKLCVVHSYHDLQIILLVNQENSKKYRYIQWYPHTHIEAIGTGGVIDNGAVADQILLSMHKVIKERQMATSENGNKSEFKPHYIFIIDEPKLIADHIIMEYLSKNESYAYSLIYTSNMQENLPENIGTIIKYKDSDNARLIINERVLNEQDFKLDRIGNVNLEWMARNLSVLVHEQGLVMHLPESITFFEMYGVNHPSQMNILERWKTNSSNKSLAVPLGIRVTGETLMLNLHEKAHGPHGLIAGTTGSGKSEIIQSYILSLAANFHPYEVGFLLIDFKGGGMSHLFKDLPHVLGTITNLDAASSMRALASIDSEMKRRQRIFAENNVNHINGYVSLFKEGTVSEPLPHLFIISDEFAELKKEQPEFMNQLVSTARLGRSLGIHLILATQKPSGVVTDQIWSNSRFKLALKVQDDQDSKEIIKTSDAAYIRNAGRAYLQVGNNEIYELFQSAFSGALCSEESYEEVVDDRVYIRNHLGQMELLNEDLSKGEEGKEKLRKQLDVTVEYINNIYMSLDCEPVARPWLPPLEEKILSPIIEEKIEVLKENRETFYSMDGAVDLSVELGLVDLPKQQSINQYIYDLRKDGNLIIFSAPGYGKSVALTTMILTLALKSSPELLNLYILDLGSGGLLPLRHLPHCADYMSFEDSEKLSRFMQIIEDEVRIRKQLFAAASAMNFDMYNRVSETKIPAIVWFIDNYDIGKEMDQNLEMCVSHIARDGMNLGIYVIISASRPGAVRFSVINNFKSTMALYMYDKADTTSAVGKPEYGIKELRGRALVKLDDVAEMQIYTAVNVNNEEQYIDDLKAYISIINDNYNGKKPRRIPVLPSEFDIKTLKEYSKDSGHRSKLKVPVGLDVEKVDLTFVDISNRRQMIVGGPSTGKTNLLKVILLMKDDELKTYVIDDKSLELQMISGQVGAKHISAPNEYIAFFDEMRELIEARKQSYVIAKEKNPLIIPGVFYKGLEPVLVIISDLEVFTGNVSLLNDSKLFDIMVELEEVNVSIIVSSANSRSRGLDSFTKVMKETIDGVVVGNPAAQAMFSVPRAISNENPIGVSYIINRNKAQKIMVPISI